MKTEINKTLAPFVSRGIDAGSEKIGPYWQIWIGDRAGARKDGIALARELADQTLRDTPPRIVSANESKIPVETVREIVKEAPGPERVVYQDRVEYVQVKPDLEKLQAAADALRKAKKEAEVPPPELAHLIRTGETYEQTNMRLLPIYREAQHHKERAADDGNKTERVQWEAKIRKLDLAMHWMHGRLIETV